MSEPKQPEWDVPYELSSFKNILEPMEDEQLSYLEPVKNIEPIKVITQQCFNGMTITSVLFPEDKDDS